MDKTKNILTYIVGFLMLAFFSFLLYQEKIIWWHFLSFMIGLGIFLIFYFNYDKVEELLLESRKLKIFVKMTGKGIEKIKTKIDELREHPEDLEIHAEEKVSVEEGKANVLVSPKGIKLINIVNDVDALLADAEKQLSGKLKRLSGKMYEEIPRVMLQFKSLSEPDEVIEFQSTKEFFTEKEAEELSTRILGICNPIHQAKQYEVNTRFSVKKTTSEIPPEIKE